MCPDLKTLNEDQVKMIREHLALVFTNVTKEKKPKTEAERKKDMDDLKKSLEEISRGRKREVYFGAQLIPGGTAKFC